MPDETIDDPFAKYGGSELKKTQPASGDPFAKFGGSEIKKTPVKQPESTPGFRPATDFKKSAPALTKPMQVQGIEKAKNSWKNLGTFVPQTVLGGFDKDAGQAIQFLGAKGLGDNNILAKDYLINVGKKLEGWGKEHDEQAQQYGLPQTTGGSVASSAIGFVPDLLELAITPELDVAKLGKLGDVLAKYGGKYAPKAANLAVGKFPIQQGSKGLISGYSEGKEQGMSDEDATSHALKKGVQEYGKGVLFEGAGAAAGKVSDIGKKLLEEKGLLSANKITSGAQKSILHSSAQAAAFSAVPFITNALQGKHTSLDEIKNNAVFGGVMGLFHIPGQHTTEEPTAADGSAKEVLDRSPIIDMHNFMSADMDAIKYAHDLEHNPADLQMKAATHAQDAFKEQDPQGKQDNIVQSSINGKLSSVKSVTQAILKDKNGVIDSINDLPVSEETKQAIIDKVNQVHKELDPTEQKKTAIGKKIAEKDNQINNLSEKTDDPVKNAENEVGLEEAKKEREELNNELKSVILKQKENESKNEGTRGQPTPTEKESKAGQAIGKDEPTVQQKGNNDEGRQKLNEPITGEGKTDPVINEQDHAISKPEATSVPVQPEAKNSEGVPEGNTEGAGITKGGKEEKSNETETPQKVKPTSIKKVITEATRLEKGLPDVELPKLGKDKETLELGKKLVGTGAVKPHEVIDRVMSNKGIYSPDEAAAMQYHMYQLRSEETNLRSQIADVDKKLEDIPNSKQHQDAKILLQGNLRQLDDRVEEATRANRINSRSWGNLGNIMQIEADHSFSPSNIRAIISDNYDGKMPKDVQDRLDKAISERDKALSDLKKATENFTVNQGGRVVERIRKSVGLVKQTKAELETEAEDLKTQLRKALKADFSRVNSGIPLPTETLAVLGKLAVNYFKQGVKDFEGLAHKIFQDVEDTGIEKSQVREYLTHYEPLREESKKRDIELLGRKERSAVKQVETGKIIDRSRKPKIVYPKDNDIIRAEQRVKDAEFKLKQEKEKSYKNTKSKTQRGLDWVIRWERRFVLSSPAILEKLGSAVTFGGAFRRLPEEAIGGMWSGLFKAMADKAPIEGGFNAKAEVEYWKEFSNPKKFLHNSKEILKTGASDLTKEFSDKPHEHYQYYDALTDLHPIIKDLSKRATYEASLIKGLNWAERNGLDISDPLIRQNIKQQAYNRAEYEIFQENSGWGRKLQNFLRDEKEPKNTKDMLTRFVTRFMLPVATVPLNIARRVGNYATGLPRGLINTREAYKKGIENLSNEQAEIIMKQLKQGSMGAALITMGLFGVGGSYGGFYNKDDKGGLKRAGPFTPGFDEMYFGDTKVHKPIQHALPFQLIQLGATLRSIHELYINKYTYGDGEYKGELEKQMEATAQAIMATTGAVAEQIPMVETPFEMYESLSDPYMRKKLGKDLTRRVTPTIVTDAVKLAK
jgi:hypothetical protein